MSSPIPPLPLPVPTTSLTLPTVPVTVSLPVPAPSVSTPTTTATIATTTPSTPGAVPGPGPTSQPPTSVPATGTSPPPSPTGSPSTTSGQTPTSPTTSAQCVDPTSSSTTAPDGSAPDSSDTASTEPAVQLPPSADCEQSRPGSGTAQSSTQPLPSGLTAPDLETVAAAASLEQLLVNAYAAVREAAGAETLGGVPPASDNYLAKVMTHHQAALEAWNDVLATAGLAAVATSPLNLTVTVNEQFAIVTDITGAAGVLSSLETTAAATYLHAVGTLQSPLTISLAASIHPVDRQHVSVLQFLLGRDPTPDTFATEDFAYIPRR
jgi:Ferritin-like domain